MYQGRQKNRYLPLLELHAMQDPHIHLFLIYVTFEFSRIGFWVLCIYNGHLNCSIDVKTFLPKLWPCNIMCNNHLKLLFPYLHKALKHAADNHFSAFLTSAWGALFTLVAFRLLRTKYYRMLHCTYMCSSIRSIY